MKKKILFLSTTLVLALLASSCSSDSDCSRCREITKKNNQIIKQGDAIEYCGSELTEKETAEPVTIGEETTSYSCE